MIRSEPLNGGAEEDTGLDLDDPLPKGIKMTDLPRFIKILSLDQNSFLTK